MVWLKRDSLTRLAPAATRETTLPPASQLPSDPSPARKAEVLTQIRKLIENGHFPPGSRLPPERALAAQLGVGRPSLREAIKALNVLEELESRRGAGTFVKARIARRALA
jgi:DNA-binding FadR family transcriptional regulator